jgi:hypothetical protein
LQNRGFEEAALAGWTDNGDVTCRRLGDAEVLFRLPRERLVLSAAKRLEAASKDPIKTPLIPRRWGNTVSALKLPSRSLVKSQMALILIGNVWNQLQDRKFLLKNE